MTAGFTIFLLAQIKVVVFISFIKLRWGTKLISALVDIMGVAKLYNEAASDCET